MVLSSKTARLVLRIDNHPPLIWPNDHNIGVHQDCSILVEGLQVAHSGFGFPYLEAIKCKAEEPTDIPLEESVDVEHDRPRSDRVSSVPAESCLRQDQIRQYKGGPVVISGAFITIGSQPCHNAKTVCLRSSSVAEPVGPPDCGFSVYPVYNQSVSKEPGRRRREHPVLRGVIGSDPVVSYYWS